MNQTPELFWKNFRLGTELQISGSFLYNALYFFDKMEHFYYEDECFEFLYNTSVGLERLEKIALILSEHNGEVSQQEFEKSLITHNHLELLRRIKKKNEITLGKAHNKFLQLLSEFYHSTRYDRYNMSSVYHKNQDKEVLVKFIEDELKITIDSDSIFPTGNDSRIKNFIGRVISTIATKLYDLIRSRAYELKIFTYEISTDSKAYKIFIERQYTFEKEKFLKKEILLNLLKVKRDDGFNKFIETIDPIEFDSYDTNEYVKVLIDTHKKSQWIDELDYIYEENGLYKERFSNIDIIGSDVTFEYENEEDEDIF